MIYKKPLQTRILHFIHNFYKKVQTYNTFKKILSWILFLITWSIAMLIPVIPWPLLLGLWISVFFPKLYYKTIWNRIELNKFNFLTNNYKKSILYVLNMSINEHPLFQKTIKSQKNNMSNNSDIKNRLFLFL